MIRSLHRWPGLLALGLLLVLAVSGAALSVLPAAERIAAPQALPGQSVADLASIIQGAYPGLEQIRRAPSGQITAYWFEGGMPGSGVIDPATGLAVGTAAPDPVARWLSNLHRSLFLGDTGRVLATLGAGAMLVLALSGAVLVARRAGGWRRWFAPLRGPLSGRLHVEIARVAVFGLALSSATALWMSAATFEIVPQGTSMPRFPEVVSGETGVALSDIELLAQTPVQTLRALSFPYPGDARDVFTLKTDLGTGYLDQGSGATLAWADLSGWQRVSETIYALHTGQGASVIGLVLGLALGLMALGVPAMGVTGCALWVSRRRAVPGVLRNLRDTCSAARAETILLVASEGGSTWGFAATLQRALRDAGQSVHLAPMARFEPARYASARRIILLAATYGDGDAPSGGKGVLEQLERLDPMPNTSLAVLGFGDRSYPAYCGFAQRIAKVSRVRGWQMLTPFDTVDRQSPQDFARWGQALGAALGIPLDLAHQPVAPPTQGLTLVSRRDYGARMQAPTAILRFALPRAPLWDRLMRRGFARFAPGDLIGVVPQGSAVPRLYSLASGRRDGFVEIVVKRHPAGLCSAQLTRLAPGDTIRAFVRPNPRFRPGKGSAPLILIGAGTGIGPLAGFIRENARQRPIHLFFGMRHRDSDFLYAKDLADWQAKGALTRLETAASRGASAQYVQDALRAEGRAVARLVAQGARIMVCGGRGMANGVTEALAEIVAPLGLTPAGLRAEGRYVEDVY